MGLLNDPERERLEALRRLQRLLDQAFRVPGTGVRFGWDAIAGLVPWAGDVLTALLGGAILVHAHQTRVPGVVQMRMLINLAIDLFVGVVPFAGDVADVFWKANTKNADLLAQYQSQPEKTTTRSRGFAILVVVVLLLILASILTTAALLLRWLLGLTASL